MRTRCQFGWPAIGGLVMGLLVHVWVRGHPLDAGVLWVFAGLVVLFGLLGVLERRELRKADAVVRTNLRARACDRCGGPPGDWDGRFYPGDVHFNPGGYLPMVEVPCARCRARLVFYVGGDGSLISDRIFREYGLHADPGDRATTRNADLPGEGV